MALFEQTVNAGVGQAFKQFILDGPTCCPREDGTAALLETPFGRSVDRHIAVPQYGGPVAERQESVGTPEGGGATAVDDGDAVGGQGCLASRHPVLVDAAHEADLGGAFANENRWRKQRVGMNADCSLHVVVRADAGGRMLSIPLTHHKQLVARKFADCDRGVGGDEHLQRRIRFLCTQSVDQANNPVWFKTVFKFVHKRDGRAG